MPLSLHIVPTRKSSEVIVALHSGSSLAAPIDQSRWPNWVKFLRTLEIHLDPEDRRQVHQSLAAGSAVWLQHLKLSDADLDELGF